MDFHRGLPRSPGCSQLQAYITTILGQKNALSWNMDLMLMVYMVGIGRYMFMTIILPIPYFLFADLI
jgi:hypothetical protein